MSSIERYGAKEIRKNNPCFSEFKSIIETAFYVNTAKQVKTIEEAYSYALETPGTVVTDIPIKYAQSIGFAEGAKVLLFNDGEIVGRTARARQIIGWPNVNQKKLVKILREAVFHLSRKQTYKTDVIVGLSEEFTLKSHLLIPKDYANNLLSYLVNFQNITAKASEIYEKSKKYDVPDIYLLADPDFYHPDFPQGLVLFDPKTNVAAVLGLRYFGELKKATLTLAWNTAHLHGYIACHGGVKQYVLENDTKYTMAAFGLSGSGKSTITLAKHCANSKVTVLHDDAFVINKESGATTALEPAYFDKTNDYPMGTETIDYFLTIQNVGVTLDENNQKVLVTEDIRNGNGRTVKSRFATPRRSEHLKEGIDAVYWIMQDDTLPPIVKISDPNLAAIFGLTLATKRSTAENVSPKKSAEIVIEPFANPFRCYPLSEDFADFEKMFSTGSVACYILNTGTFNGKKVHPKDTLHAIELVVNSEAKFEPFGFLNNLSYLNFQEFPVDFTDRKYLQRLQSAMKSRLSFIQNKAVLDQGFHALPCETKNALLKIIEAIDEELILMKEKIQLSVKN